MTQFVDYIMEQLKPLQPIYLRRMFNSCGLFRDNHMFALIHKNQLYIKVDRQSKKFFLEAGSEPFIYFIKRNQERHKINLNYYLIPESALDNSEDLLYWIQLGLKASVQ